MHNPLFEQVTAVGFTAKGMTPRSVSIPRIYWECIGTPPYPGSRFPRVVAIATLEPTPQPGGQRLLTLHGDALEPRGMGPRIIAQIVNDKASTWGAGFARAVRLQYPEVQTQFKDWVNENRRNLSLGKTHFAPVSPDLTVCSMVAQHGFGESEKPRLRYAALKRCLLDLKAEAQRRRASVHMPRIGSGWAGGNWSIIAQLIDEALVAQGVEVTVYIPPADEPASKPVVRLPSGPDLWTFDRA